MADQVTDNGTRHYRDDLCDGCNVREPFEHRCHGSRCPCEECRMGDLFDHLSARHDYRLSLTDMAEAELYAPAYTEWIGAQLIEAVKVAV